MDSEKRLITEEMINTFDTIRFSDSALDSSVSCSSTQEECDSSTTNSNSASDPSLKDHTPEEISFWINFGYFRK